MILSILIPTTPDRLQMTEDIMSELYRQIDYMKRYHWALGDIEILFDDSKKFLDGGLSIGKKRGSLVKRAEGKYCCFVDSDDWVAPNYMETIVRACQSDADIITFRALARLSGYWSVVDMHSSFVNEEASPNGITKRSPSIVCPVKTAFAKKVDFEDINYGEDYKWITEVLKMCTSDHYDPVLLYEYRHGQHSESDKIIKAGYV